MASVLIAEDEPRIRRFLRRSLELVGHDVVSCEDGRAALAQLAERGFDVVVSDLFMPHVNGMDLLRHVTSSNPAIGFILVTAYSRPALASEAKALGAAVTLVKPLSGPEAIQAAVASLIAGRDASSAVGV